jgi:ABC-2 type transport system permease protein
MWQLLPVLIGAFRVEFEFRELLRFPLRFSTFFLLTLAYGMLDLAPLMAVLWLTGFFAGLLTTNGILFPILAPLYFLFLLVCLLLNRVIYLWFERLLGTRRGREIFFMTFILVMMSFQFGGIFAERLGPSALPYFFAARAVLDMLPPGLAGQLIHNASAIFSARPDIVVRTTPNAFLVPFTLLALYAILFALFLRRRLLAQYRGEDLGESAAASARARPAERAALDASLLRSAFAWLHDPVAAMVEKELRYMVRNPAILVNLAVPLVMVVFLGFAFSDPREEFRPLRNVPELIYSAAAGYALLVLPVLSMNAFAYDAKGIQFLLTAPVKFRDVLLAKNIAYGGVNLLEVLLLWPVVTLLAQPPPFVSVLFTLIGAGFAILVYLTIGNLLSLAFPRAFDFGSFRQKQSGVAIFLYFLTQIVLAAVLSAVMLFARWKENLWIAAVAYSILFFAMIPIYHHILESCSELADKRREVLTSELCR